MTLKPGYVPPDVARALQAARLVEPDKPPGESLKRTRAIDLVYAKAREDYPNLFKREPMKLNLTNLRIAFPSLFEATSIDGGKATYNAKFPVDPSDPQVKVLDAAMRAVAVEKWKEKGDTIFDRMTKTGKPKTLEVAFAHQPYVNASGDVYAGFEDMFTLSANSAARPLIIDRDRTTLVAADGRPYGGCYVNVQIELWAQDNKWGKGIRAQLKGVQFVKDGDAFSGGAPASADDFEDLGEGADAGGLA